MMVEKTFQDELNELNEEIFELSTEELIQLRIKISKELTIKGLEYLKDYQPKTENEAEKILKTVLKSRKVFNRTENNNDIISLCDEIIKKY